MPDKIEYKLPENWTSWASFQAAMRACNEVKFTPLAKMTEAERLELANKYDALTSEVQPEDYDILLSLAAQYDARHGGAIPL